jgi:hypothetical protein
MASGSSSIPAVACCSDLSRRKCLTYRFRADHRPDFRVPCHGIREINCLHLLREQINRFEAPSALFQGLTYGTIAMTVIVQPMSLLIGLRRHGDGAYDALAYRNCPFYNESNLSSRDDIG